MSDIMTDMRAARAEYVANPDMPLTRKIQVFAQLYPRFVVAMVRGILDI